jgi:hypothetical protein
MEAEILIMLQDLMKYRSRIEVKNDVLIPDVRWTGQRERVGFTDVRVSPEHLFPPFS